MTKREQQYLDRYAQALATTKIWNEDYAGELSIFGTCPSTSSEPDVYIISISAQTLYSTGCTCLAGENKLDCLHRSAADRLLDDRRDAMKCQVKALVARVENAMDRWNQFFIWKQSVEADAMAAEYVALQSGRTCSICGRLLKGSVNVCGGCIGYCA